MKTLKISLLIFTFILTKIIVNAQVGINATGAAPATNAMLDVSSSNKGVLLPRMASNASIPAPTKGMIFFNTTSNKFEYFDGSAWQSLTSQAALPTTTGTIALTAKLSGNINENIPISTYGVGPWEFIGVSANVTLAANQRVVMSLTGALGRSTASTSIPRTTIDVGYSLNGTGPVTIAHPSTFTIIKPYFPLANMLQQVSFFGTFKPGEAGIYKIGPVIRCDEAGYFTKNDYLSGYYQIINE
jgi:hypothetical protein